VPFYYLYYYFEYNQFSMKNLLLVTMAIAGIAACKPARLLPAGSQLQYCAAQAGKTVSGLNSADSMPRSINSGGTKWQMVGYRDWTAGFWPGILWNLYAYTGDTAWKARAIRFSYPLERLAYSSGFDHDLGFQLYCSLGKGFRLTGDTSYKKVLLAAADSLATLFNPRVGTILSWPRNVKRFGGHNTIIDNMMNLELLFWASKNGGAPELYNIAVTHAITTMQHHFRPDYTSYHLVVYDTLSGHPIRKQTHQGYADASMWARGQSWAIYGFTLCYRETHDARFLDFAQHVADVYLARLPKDRVPYWDFNAPGIPHEPRDASAAAITASALLELSGFVPGQSKSRYYREQAIAMLASLSGKKYQGRNTNNAFLRHCTGHKPNGGEIDASIIYADYYYLEALLRLQKWQAEHTR
jgi:unsaturated chondroitin disaccharide hydrolase